MGPDNTSQTYGGIARFRHLRGAVLYGCLVVMFKGNAMRKYAKKAFLALAMSSAAGVVQADIVTGISYTDVAGIRVGSARVGEQQRAGATLDGQFGGRY